MNNNQLSGIQLLAESLLYPVIAILHALGRAEQSVAENLPDEWRVVEQSHEPLVPGEGARLNREPWRHHSGRYVPHRSRKTKAPIPEW